MRPEEEGPTRDLMRLISWSEVDESLSEAAGALGRRHLRAHPRIDVSDLIVAALAQQLDADLKTTNLTHFPMFKDLKAPYESLAGTAPDRDHEYGRRAADHERVNPADGVAAHRGFAGQGAGG